MRSSKYICRSFSSHKSFIDELASYLMVLFSFVERECDTCFVVVSSILQKARLMFDAVYLGGSSDRTGSCMRVISRLCRD